MEDGASSPLGRLGRSCGIRTHLGYLLEFPPTELEGPQSTLPALSGCFVLGPHVSVVQVTKYMSKGAGRWKIFPQTLCSLTTTLHLLAAIMILEWTGWHLGLQTDREGGGEGLAV